MVARQQETSEDKPPISVIVAARNEEAMIGKCLQSLVQQDYPKNAYEVIVVDDRSDDGTAAIVKNYALSYPFVSLAPITHLDSDLPPKKNALHEGIRRSGFDILAFTDADCVVPPQWLASIAREFLPDTGVVAGYSPIEQQFPASMKKRWGNFFVRYLEVKNSFGAAAGIGLRRAYLCTGRNLSYRKSIFTQVDGFEKIKNSISGDDDLFLQLVQKETQWNIRYMLSPQSYVETAPPASLRAFINQRKRHFSAGKFYPGRMKVVFATVHAFNALSFLTIFVSPAIGAAAVAAKLLVDGWTISRGAALFGDRKLVRSLVPLEIASVLYNSFIGPLGVFGTFVWKESKT
ncbi:MAG TPA: glycosyltransferase [Bacteroidota bacterium]|nr:glycosyltransferase [Bacteroidota bacterium]